MPKTKHRHGVEVRRDESGEIDEVILSIGGETVAHLERTGDGGVWIGLQASGRPMMHVDIGVDSEGCVSVQAEER